MDQSGGPPDATREEADSKSSAESLMSSKYGSVREKILTDSDSDSESEPELECKVCDKRFSGFKPFLQHEKSLKHKRALQKGKKSKELLEKIDAAEKESDEGDPLAIADAFATCKACKKEFGCPESYLAHLQSKAHRKKVRQAAVLDQARLEGGEMDLDKLMKLLKKEKIEVESGETMTFECRDCDKSFSGLEPYVQHMASKVHAKTVEKNKLMDDLVQRGAQKSDSSRLRGVNSLALEDEILVCKLCSVTFTGPETATQHLKSRGHKKKLEKLEWRQKKRISAGKDAQAGSSAAKEEGRPDEEESSSSDASETGSDEDEENAPEGSGDVTYEILPDNESATSGDRPEDSTATKSKCKSSAAMQGSDEVDSKAAADHFTEYILHMTKEDKTALEKFRNDLGSEDTSDDDSEDTSDEDCRGVVENQPGEVLEKSLLSISRKHEKQLRSSTSSGHQIRATTDFEKISQLYAAYKRKLEESKDSVKET